MSRTSVDDYIQKGMYGAKQTKPDERKKFLGTIRERIVVALTKSQVMENGIYPEVVQYMKEHPKAVLLLNGEMDYSFLSKYIQIARARHIHFSIITDRENRTNIGLVLTYHHAIDKEDIYVSKKSGETKALPQKKKRRFIAFIKRILKFNKKKSP